MAGALPLRYCEGRFASKIPTWRLLLIAGLVAEEGGREGGGRRRGVVGIVRVERGAPAVVPGSEGDGRVDWISGPGGGVERVRLNRKKLQHTL